MREQTMIRKRALFVDVIISLKKNVSKVLGRKMKKLVWLVIQTIDKWNGYLEKQIDVDLNIT